MQIGVGFPLLTQSFHLPSPFVCPTDHLKGGPFGWQVGQKIAKAFRARVPADDQPQAEEVAGDLPLPPEFPPLTFGQLGVESLEWLVTKRAKPLPIFAKRLDDLRIHPGFRPAEKEATRI